jgi:Predicted polymerase, most proteins contain PALM domain, HD hydrolase domain and Zn-ribbon domain
MPEEKERIILNVSPDRLTAFITINPLEEGESPITEKEIRDALDKARIVYGIKEDTIQRIISLQYADKFIIAEGIPPKTGRMEGLNIKLT